MCFRVKTTRCLRGGGGGGGLECDTARLLGIHIKLMFIYIIHYDYVCCNVYYI